MTHTRKASLRPLGRHFALSTPSNESRSSHCQLAQSRCWFQAGLGRRCLAGNNGFSWHSLVRIARQNRLYTGGLSATDLDVETRPTEVNLSANEKLQSNVTVLYATSDWRPLPGVHA